jgi:hypothetical protein
MTPQKLELYKNKALQIREKLLAAESLSIPVDHKKLTSFQKGVKNLRGKPGMCNYLRSKLRDADLIFHEPETKTYFWNEDNDHKLNDVILEYAKECELRYKEERKQRALERNKKKQDTIHKPMLFDSVMREQDQSTVTLKLSPEQFEQLKKHHQLLTTILTTTNQ